MAEQCWRVIFVAAVAILVACGEDQSNGAFVGAGSHALVSEASPVCRVLQAAKDAERIRQSGDRDGFLGFMSAEAATGNCRLLVKGSKVQVMELAMWEGLARVRKVGEAESYWIARRWLQKDDAATR